MSDDGFLNAFVCEDKRESEEDRKYEGGEKNELRLFPCTDMSFLCSCV